MKIWKATAAAVGMAAALGAMLFWLGRPNKPPAKPAQSAEAPMNPAHERAFLEQQLQQKPGHAPVLLRLAQLDVQEGRKDDARRRLEEAVASDPAAIEARLELSRLCYEMGDPKESLKQVQAILDADPKNVDALYNLGAIHANAGHLGDARRYWALAKTAAPDSPSGKKAAQALAQVGN